MTSPLLVNPTAGAVRSGADALVRAASAVGVPIVETADRAMLVAAVESAVSRRDERVLVAGGDGTVHHTLPALAGSRTALGIVPCGRGNDLTRALGLPTDPETALRRALTGRRRRIDLGMWGTVPFAGALSTGLDAAVADRMRACHGGPARYAVEAVRLLIGFRPAEIDYSLNDGPPRRRRAWMLAVANSGVYGGGLRVAPDALIDDGMLDLVVVGPATRARVALLLAAARSARHVHSPAVETARATSVSIVVPDDWTVCADGESLERPPDGRGTVRLAAGAIDVIV